MSSNKFSKQFMDVLNDANVKRQNDFGGEKITTKLFLYSLFSNKDFRQFKVLTSLKELGVNIDSLGESIKLYINIQDPSLQIETLVDEEFANIIEKAQKIAAEFKTEYIELELILLAILNESSVSKVFEDYGITAEKFKKKIVSSVVEETVEETKNTSNINAPILSAFSRNLKTEYENGKLNKVFGRDKEIEQVVQILSRRFKNNPILIGDAGVGKSSVIEGLQARICEGNVPEHLKGCEIFDLSTNNMVSGSKWRGQFEERIQAILKEIERDQRIIIFFDEFHTIVSAGTFSDSPNDLSNSLKPALARGGIKCIGATTRNEYVKYVEKDQALNRRMQPVNIEEPYNESLNKIIEQSIDGYEKFYNIKVNGLTELITKMSRYIPDRFNPDKSFDILDSALASARCSGKKEIDSEDIIKATSVMSKVPETFLKNANSKEFISKFDEYMNSNIINQETILNVFRKRLLLAQKGINFGDKPRAVILIDGPEGVGKTESCFKFGEFLLGRRENVKRLDMSNFKDKINLTSLAGAPPGYVGYSDNNNNLCEYIRRNHLAVVILDEIDEAHPDVLDFFLKIFESGNIEDNQGRKVSLGNTFFFMTSNISSKIVRDDVKKLGFVSSQDNKKDESYKEIRKRFKVKFYDRIDDVIIANKLTNEDLYKITSKLIDKLTQQIDCSIKFTNKKALIEYVSTKETNDKKYVGARHLSKILEEILIIPIIEYLNTNESQSIKIKLDKEKILINECSK